MQQAPKKRKFALTPAMRLQARQAQRKSRLAQQESSAGLRLVQPLNSAEILQQRALDLARPLAQTNLEMLVENTVVLQQQNCRIALPVNFVREIIALENITPIPGVPDFIVGVVNVRGKIITLVNLEIFIEGRTVPPNATREAANTQSIVMVELDDFEFGLLCQNFPAVCYLADKNIKMVTDLALDYPAEFLNGLTQDGILCLNLPAILNNPAFLVIQE